MTINIPRFKCYVDKYFLTNKKEKGLIEAYCIAVTTVESRPLLWTIHTIEGALWSRIPTWAIYTKPTKLRATNLVDLWGAISSNSQVVKYNYLKDYWVKTKFGDGIYQFTIDYFKDGFSEDPEQHKTSNIIFLENGYVVAMPNNYCIFKDRHFTIDKIKTKYQRTSEYYKLW